MVEFVYARMKEHLLNQEILHADETTLQVLHESNRICGFIEQEEKVQRLYFMTTNRQEEKTS